MAAPHHLDTCWLCGGPMDKSREHVLPESITYSSSLWVSGFICTRCNNRTGTEWDVAIASVCQPAFRTDLQYPPHLRKSGPKFTPAEFITSDGEVIAGTQTTRAIFERPQRSLKKNSLTMDTSLCQFKGPQMISGSTNKSRSR